MLQRFPPIEPFSSGVLSSGDGHQIFWEWSGNPDGEPALFLHGGPGSGSSPGQRRLFDPQRFRVLLFDQRGCGRSRPLASEPDADLRTNTTQHLIEDIEELRSLHDVDRWTVLGLSWGSTLGLAYAHEHPERVRSLVLGLVGTTSRREVEWITAGVGRIFPIEWDRFAAHVADRPGGESIVDAYARLLFDGDPHVRDAAARAWCDWEDTHVSLTPGHQPDPRFDDAAFRLGFARLVTHYWRNAAFLKADQLLKSASKLNGIPGVLIHGRHDVSGPLETAWRLSNSWLTSRLVVLDDAGHGGGASFVDAIIGGLAESG